MRTVVSRSVLPLLVILVSGATELLAADDPADSKPKTRDEVRALRSEVDELKSRLTRIEELLQKLQPPEPKRPQTAATVEFPLAPRKFRPKLFHERQTDLGRELAAAGEKGAAEPFRKWSLSEAWSVNGIAMSPDGTLVLAGGDMGEWRLCNVQTGEVVHSREHPYISQVNSAAISPDGQMLALGGTTSFHLLKTARPEEDRMLQLPATVKTIDFSPNGELVAIGGWHPDIRVLRTADLSVSRKVDTGLSIMHSVRFSSDGQRLGYSGGHTSNPVLNKSAPEYAGLFDLATGVKLLTVSGQPMSYAYLAAEIVPGQSLLVAGPRDTTLWNVAEKTPIREITGGRGNRNLDISADRRRLLIGPDDNRVAVVDVETGRELHSLRIPSHWRSCAALSPDGRYIAAGGSDGGIRVWELK